MFLYWIEFFFLIEVPFTVISKATSIKIVYVFSIVLLADNNHTLLRNNVMPY